MAFDVVYLTAKYGCIRNKRLNESMTNFCCQQIRSKPVKVDPTRMHRQHGKSNLITRRDFLSQATLKLYKTYHEL